jgi:hypothetical protein
VEDAGGVLAAMIADIVAAELALPGGEGSAPATHLSQYFAETRPEYNLAFVWKMFRDFLDLDRFRLPALRVADFETQVRPSFPVQGDPGLNVAPGPAESWINARLRGFYAWSDKLADHYADAHRSGFVLSSLLAATAVFTALLPVAGHFGRQAAIATAILEAGVLAVMVGLPMLARRGRWHQKWLEYRVLAELVRELRILIPLGGARPSPRTSAHLANYGDPTRSWMYWQARAIARSVGLPNVRVTTEYISSQIEALLQFVGAAPRPGVEATGQLGFHRMNCERMERIHHRLHRLSLILFTVTMVAVGANWLQRFIWPEGPERVSDWLVLFSAFLPALGASLASINNQGEFARLQRRSRAMAESLAAVRERIAALADQLDTPPLAAVTDLAAQIAAMMIEENTEWRIVVLDLPHAAG